MILTKKDINLNDHNQITIVEGNEHIKDFLYNEV